MFTSPLQVLVRRWKLIVLVGIIIGILSGVITMLFPLKYRADSQVLIIANARYGVDPYTVVKSAERVGENISQVMRTSDFYMKVKEQPNNAVDWTFFEKFEEREKRKLWQKTLAPSVVYGTGVLSVSVYHPDAQQAQNLANAATQALASKGWEYVGGDVSIKIVNAPVVTKWPVQPSVALNAILGFIVGIFLGSIILVRRRA